MGAMGPSMAPLEVERGEERWRQFDNSVSAVSFGFVATAILISMFLIMAIFERFLRPRPPLAAAAASLRGRGSVDLEAQQRRNLVGKLDYPSPKMSVYAKGVSVLMPGQDVPTFIAHPAPPPCPLERISWPSHQPAPTDGPTSTSSSS